MFAVAFVSVLAGTIACLAVAGIEQRQNLGGNWGITRPFARMILFIWMFVGAVLLVGVAARYLALRRLSKPAARLLLRELLWDETRREQERIYRWRRWRKKKTGSGAQSKVRVEVYSEPQA